MTAYDFQEKLAESASDAVHDRVEKFLLLRFPDALSVRRAALANDKAGADIIIEFPHGQFRFVDLKVRQTDFRARGQADVALELWSNVERQKPGWAVDDAKLTDYIVFYWVDTDRIVIVDARALRAVTKKNMKRWQRDKKRATQRTTLGSSGGYTSSVIFVSSDELAERIRLWMGVQDAKPLADRVQT